MIKIVQETRDELGTARGIAIAASEPSRASAVDHVVESVQVVLVLKKLAMTTKTGSQSMGFVMKFVRWVLPLPFRLRGSVPPSFERTHFDSKLHHLLWLALAHVQCLRAHGS